MLRPEPAKHFEIKLAGALLLLLMMWALAGCPHPPNPPATNPVDMAYTSCTLDMQLPTGPGDPDGVFTKEGLKCVACPGTYNCLDVHDVVYCCDQKGCLRDPHCTSAPLTADFGTATMRKK